MLKQLICLSLIASTQLAVAAPNQYEAIDRGYDLSCEINKDGKVFSSKLDLKATSSDVNTYLAIGLDLLGSYIISVPLQDQKFLEYKSDDTKTRNYIDTKFPQNQISYKKTLKFGLLGKERLQTAIKINFSDASLRKGTLEFTSYWPEKNNVTICSVTEAKN